MATTQAYKSFTESMIRENMTQHKEDILKSLNASRLGDLIEEFELGEKFSTRVMLRSRQAKKLYSKVVKTKKFVMFLKSLESDDEHQGHRYIVSLLRGEEFAREEEVEESKKIQERMKKKANLVRHELSSYIQDLLAPLEAENLVTSEEIEELRHSHTFNHEKARKLLELLKIKGLTAHFIFVHKVAKRINNRELYEVLAGDFDPAVHSQSSRIPTSPHRLEVARYLLLQKELEKVRKYHQIGGGKWEDAKTICRQVTEMSNLVELCSPEMKIVFLLENCNILILQKRSEVLEIVEKARRMCRDLQQCNTQALEARCEWVLGKWYRRTQNIANAKQHIERLLVLIDGCESGEERILAYYCMGCILLDSPTRSQDDQENAIRCFKTAMTCASNNDYGLKIFSHGKIRLAQAYVGSSSNRPGKSREEISQDHIAEAEQYLSDLDRDSNLGFRTRCMAQYTWSDVYRARGEMERAIDCAKNAWDIAQTQNLTYEIESIEIRQPLLKSLHR